MGATKRHYDELVQEYWRLARFAEAYDLELSVCNLGTSGWDLHSDERLAFVRFSTPEKATAALRAVTGGRSSGPLSDAEWSALCEAT